MKVIICGDRNIDDYEAVNEAVKQSKFKITEVVSGGAKGSDTIGEEWANKHKIPVVVFNAEWNNLKAEGAVVKEKLNKWTNKLEQYNANAGFARNQKMADYAEAVIAIQSQGETPGSQDMIKKAKAKGLKVFIYTGNESYEYTF